MSHNTESQVPLKWQNRIGIVPSIYRALAFAIGAVHLLVLHQEHPTAVAPIILITATGIYTLFKVLLLFSWNTKPIINIILFTSDIAICICLLLVSGGIASPFLLYSLSPVLTAALLLRPMATFVVVVPLTASVIIYHMLSAASRTSELYEVPGYIMGLCLVAILPYFTNVNLRQYLEAQDILRERHRLSRELHDTTAQTISALRWQIQQLHQRLVQKGAEPSEIIELENLATKAYSECRESLDLLRSQSGEGNFVLDLKDYLEYLKDSTGINFVLNVETEGLRIKALVRLQLMRICQGAFTNIKNHSGAQNVNVLVTSETHHLTVSISDDGSGFDSVAYYRNAKLLKRQGLAIMRERAESVGGKFRVLSMPGKGTEIQVKVPVDSRDGGVLWLSR